MRTLALTILTLAIVLAGQARAQTYDPAFPVCMHVISWGGGSYYDCNYHTMGQCAASASGRAAQCDPNPHYAGATASVRGNKRRYRRGEESRTTPKRASPPAARSQFRPMLQ